MSNIFAQEDDNYADQQDVDSIDKSNKPISQTFSLDSKGCNPDLPTLSVGDFNVSDSEGLTGFKNKYNLFILSVSDSFCEECCKSEIMLKSIQDHIKYGRVGYRNEQIPIVRLDYSEHHESLVKEGLNMNRVPKTFLYFKDRFYPFEEVDMDSLLLHFMNRVLYPVVILKTSEDVKRFIDHEEWQEDTPFYKNGYIELGEQVYSYFSKVTRVIALISDKTEYKEEISMISDDARELTKREDLRIAKVTNPKLVAEFKKKYGRKWFGDTSSNSIVAIVKNKDDKNAKTFVYDLSVDTKLIEKWINEVSLQPVEELSGSVIKITSYVQKAMFTAFIDRSDPAIEEESNNVYKRLNEIAKNFPQYQFTYTEDPNMKEKKEECGITWEEEPSLALNNFFKSDTTYVFPRRQLMSKKNLKAFFDACNKGTLHDDDFRLPDRVRNFDSKMKHSLKLTEENYKPYIEDLHRDRMVLIFDSSSKDFDRSKKLAVFFGKAAKRFHELGLDGKPFFSLANLNRNYFVRFLRHKYAESAKRAV